MNKKKLLTEFEYPYPILNWRRSMSSSIPRMDSTKINIYEFNHDEQEPLRAKYIEAEDTGEYIDVDWCCQEPFDDISGMRDEIRRFLKENMSESVILKFHVFNRDGGCNKNFTIKITK